MRRVNEAWMLVHGSTSKDRWHRRGIRHTAHHSMREGQGWSLIRKKLWIKEAVLQL
jgi:hypothetical protein